MMCYVVCVSTRIVMAKLIVLTGKKFGKLLVLRRAENKGKKTCWLCLCDCGNETVVGGSNLHSGNTSSCGCSYNHEFHGLRYTKLYGVWATMKNRCSNPSVKEFKSYGARGIKVCPKWASSFIAFHDWAMSNGYKDGLTIDRIDVDGNYEPSNCQWVDKKTQQSNRRNNLLIEIDGETHIVTEWGRISGVSRQTIVRRYKKGVRGKTLIGHQRISS